jgi:hypothetical protein
VKLALLARRRPSTWASSESYEDCAAIPAKPAATCVSNTLRTSAPKRRRSSAMSWRPACTTISTAGSASTSASGAPSMASSSGSISSMRAGWAGALEDAARDALRDGAAVGTLENAAVGTASCTRHSSVR